MKKLQASGRRKAAEAVLGLSNEADTDDGTLVSRAHMIQAEICLKLSRNGEVVLAWSHFEPMSYVNRPVLRVTFGCPSNCLGGVCAKEDDERGNRVGVAECVLYMSAKMLSESSVEVLHFPFNCAECIPCWLL